MVWIHQLCYIKIINSLVETSCIFTNQNAIFVMVIHLKQYFHNKFVVFSGILTRIVGL